MHLPSQRSIARAQQVYTTEQRYSRNKFRTKKVTNKPRFHHLLQTHSLLNIEINRERFRNAELARQLAEHVQLNAGLMQSLAYESAIAVEMSENCQNLRQRLQQQEFQISTLEKNRANNNRRAKRRRAPNTANAAI